MIPFRVRISDAATARCRYIKSRTGLTPNILCRIAMALSLREKRPVLAEAPDLVGQELNARRCSVNTKESTRLNA